MYICVTPLLIPARIPRLALQHWPRSSESPHALASLCCFIPRLLSPLTLNTWSVDEYRPLKYLVQPLSINAHHPSSRTTSRRIQNARMNRNFSLDRHNRQLPVSVPETLRPSCQLRNILVCLSPICHFRSRLSDADRPKLPFFLWM